MPNAIKKEDIAGYECKHAVYVRASDGSTDDAVVVKEYMELKDGTRIPNLRVLQNYKRDFWVTKAGHRKHKDKKEWEDIHKLQKFSTTQAKLIDSIGRALGRPGMQGSLRVIARSPYLYGCDVTTPVLIKNRYRTQWPNQIRSSSVAVLDIETDVVNGTEDILSVSLTFKDRAILVYTKDFLGTSIDPVGKTHELFESYLGEIARQRNINLDVQIADSPGDAVMRTLEKAHEWQPDFVAIWNINFDLPRMIRALERDGIPLEDAFSDPRVPQRFRYANYIPGQEQKVTSSGKIMPQHPADQWHTMECPSSFYFIDAMCVYKKVRVASGNEPSYSLDAILNKTLGLRKLKFDEIIEKADPTMRGGSLKWHMFMQRNYKIEYGIYNLFDCISVEMLDEKTKDLADTLGILCEHSEYSKFPSQPRRTVDDLHFFCLEHGMVIGTTADKMEDEYDKFVVGMQNWIVTLSSHLVVDNGLPILRELPNVRSSYRAHVADLDVSSSYPNTEDFLNISKETTWRELSKIDGVSDAAYRRCGINMTGGITNAVEICSELYRAASFDDLLNGFMADTTA